MNRFYNSHKGEIFLRKLVEEFDYDDLIYQIGAKQAFTEIFQRQQHASKEHIAMLYQAEKGSLKDIRRSLAVGRNVNYRDYDSRTALHLAANHGHFHVVKYLINRYLINQPSISLY